MQNNVDMRTLIRESITNKDIIRCSFMSSENSYDGIFVRAKLIGVLLEKSEYYCPKLMSTYIGKDNNNDVIINHNRFKYKDRMYVRLRFLRTVAYDLYTTTAARQHMIRQIETLLSNIISIANTSDIKIKEIDANKDIVLYKEYCKKVKAVSNKKPLAAVVPLTSKNNVASAEVAVQKKDPIINSCSILQKDEIKKLLMNNINETINSTMDEIKKAIEEEIDKRLDKAFSA